MDSILTSIKKLLGISEDYTQFDSDLIMHINSVFLNLTQLGVGPESGFTIEDEYTEWSDFIKNDAQLQAVKSYMYLKVKLVIESMNRMIAELEFRLNVAVD